MINNIRLQKFRSYSDESFEFSSGVNIIVGPNASGKTNLLEALQVSMVGGSYRAGDTELIKNGYTNARLEVHTENEKRVVKLGKLTEGRARKSFTINDNSFTRLTLNHTLPIVLFEPENLRLVNGPPELRRNYLDDLISQTLPGYQTLRRNYRRTLAQRNALLKRGPQTNGQLFVWNVRLSELGGQIVQARQRLVEQLKKNINRLYNQLAGKKTALTIDYLTASPADSYSTKLMKRLEQTTAQDYARGFTSEGPHRDDLLLKFGKQPAQNVASRGEMRTLLLALKMLEVTTIEDVREHPPLLLLDDVFSELDGARRHALTRFMQPYQTFITTTDADVVVQHFIDECHIIPLGGAAKS